MCLARGGNVVVYDQYDPDIHPHPPPDPQLYGFGVPQQGKDTVDFSF